MMNRFISVIIDWTIIITITFILTMIFLYIGVKMGISEVNILLLSKLFFVTLYILLFLIKDIIFKNQSIGKKLMNLEIIDKQYNSIPSASKLIIRNIPLIFFGLEVIIFAVKNQRIGGIITNTIVVNRRYR